MPLKTPNKSTNSAVSGCAMNIEKLPTGCVKRIHVNQHLLRKAVAGEDVCSYTVQFKGKSHPCKSAIAHEGVEFVNAIHKPLSCGARLYGQTTGPVTLHL